VGQQTLGTAGYEIQPVLPRSPKPEAMPVQLIRSRVQHSVEFKHGDRVVQLEATSQNSEPVLTCLLSVASMSPAWR